MLQSLASIAEATEPSGLRAFLPRRRDVLHDPMCRSAVDVETRTAPAKRKRSDGKVGILLFPDTRAEPMSDTKDQCRSGADFYRQALGFIVACALTTSWAYGQSKFDSTEVTDGPQNVAEAIELLAADSFLMREKATLYLWNAGEESVQPLRKARQSKDPEVAHRARRLLYKLEWGIFPTTSPKVVDLIKRYQSSTSHQRRILARQIFNAGLEARRSLFKIGRMETDELTRKTIADILTPYVSELVSKHLASGELDKGRKLLEFAASHGNESAIRHYAVFLILANQLQPTLRQLIASAKEQGEADLSQITAKQLMYLHRASGDLKSALKMAEKINVSLHEAMLYESGEWVELAKRKGDPVSRKISSGAKPRIEELGYAAAYFRLAGRDAEFSAIVDQIKRVETNDRYIPSWYVGEALMINDRFDDAIDAFTRNKKFLNAFELLVARWEFDRAFKLVEDPKFTGTDRFMLDLEVAKTWRNLGQMDKAQQLIAPYDDVSLDHSMLLRVIEGLRDLDMADRALTLAVKVHKTALDQGKTEPVVLSHLISDQSLHTAGRIWWTYRRHNLPDRAIEDELRLATDLFNNRSVDNANDLIKAFAQAGKSKVDTSAVKHFQAVSELANARGLSQSAAAYLKESLDADLTYDQESMAKRYRQLGQIYLDHENWSKAADAFASALKANPNDAQLLLLQGHALIKAGKPQEGGKLIDLAVLLPLADSRSRYYLAQTMSQLGMKRQAERQWQLISRTGPLDSIYVGQSLLRLFDTLGQNRQAFGLRALHAERFRLACLKANTSLTKPQYYLSVAAQAHAGAAGDLLQQGKADLALEYGLKLGELGSHSTDQVIALVGAFDKAGHKEHGDRIFDVVFKPLQGLCAKWPKSALQHNNAAWLAARCNRELDKGLEYASRAVSLRPGRASFLDTLAEVHFRRGNKAEAIKLAKRCIELDPKQPFYKQQFKRFTEAADQ